MFATITRLATGSILLLALTGCSGGSVASVATVTSVTITGGDRTISQDTTLTLTATVEVTGNASTAVTWTSSDPSVATIDATGTVTGLTPGTTTVTATSTTDPSKNDSITLTVNPPGTLQWTRQFGTSSSDLAHGVVTDADGNVYIVGETPGALEGAHAGDRDGFIRSYDSSGTIRWTRQFGTSDVDSAEDIAIDGNGNVYVTGFTRAALEGTNAGGFDAYIRSYDKDGTLRWTRQFGTSSSEAASGVATDATGNVYAAGYTSGNLQGTSIGAADAFIRSYDKDGTLRWTRQFGTGGNDIAHGIATDPKDNVYAAGTTRGALEGANAGDADAFIRSYDKDGTLRWTRQLGTSSSDTAHEVATDAQANVYVIGITEGALEGEHAGLDDAFIRSYNGDGILRWTRQFGTSWYDFATGIATDSNGNLYVAGSTAGALEVDNIDDNRHDAFIRSYDGTGGLRWTRQFGTESSDLGRGVATDADGNVYAAGDTPCALAAANAGGLDAFIRKYGP